MTSRQSILADNGPTPNATVNASLTLLNFCYGAVHLKIRQVYMNQLAQVDPSSPEYHDVVQMILMMQSEHVASLDDWYHRAARRIYFNAGLIYPHG